MTFYRLSKIAGRYERDPTQEEMKKSINDTSSFEGDKCVGNALDLLLKLQAEERKIKNDFVGYNLQLHAHNGSAFDTCIKLNILLCDKNIVAIIKNGKRIISMKIFVGYIENNKKQNPQYLVFRCGVTSLDYSMKK